MAIKQNENYLAFDKFEFFSNTHRNGGLELKSIYRISPELRETFQDLLEPTWKSTRNPEDRIGGEIHFSGSQFKELAEDYNYIVIISKKYLKNDLWKYIGSLTGIQKIIDGQEVAWVANSWWEAREIMNRGIEIMTDEEYNQEIDNYDYDNPVFQEYKKFYNYLGNFTFLNNYYGGQDPQLFAIIWDETEKRVCDVDSSKEGYTRKISQGPWKGEKIDLEMPGIKKWTLKNLCNKYVIRGGNDIILEKQKEILDLMKKMVGEDILLPPEDPAKLKKIQTIRNNATQEIINQIFQEPKLTSDDLDPNNCFNWLNKIDEAKEESVIENIKNEAITNIKKLRARKSLLIKQKLDQLISQACQTNDYEKLNSLILQIVVQFGREEIFKIRKKEIDSLRNKLSQLKPHQHRESAVREIDNKIKNSKLEEDLPKILREKIRKIKNEKLSNSQFNTLQKEVLEEINFLKSEKDLRDIIQQIQQAKTPVEKKTTWEKLIHFKNSDKYHKMAYEKMEREINEYLNQWNNSDFSGKNEPQISWKIIISLFFACTLIALVIIFLRKTKKGKKRTIKGMKTNQKTTIR